MWKPHIRGLLCSEAGWLHVPPMLQIMLGLKDSVCSPYSLLTCLQFSILPLSVVTEDVGKTSILF